MKTVFMGTPDFAVESLKALLEGGHKVTLVVTQPDKPKGRSHKLTAPPVKQFALENGLPVFQPNSLKTDESFEQLKSCAADVFVVAAYGKILPERILSLPPYGCINVHASLLPKYRGAAPIQWAVAAGESKTGVTTMQMDTGVDTGDILLKTEIPITGSDTGGTVHDKLAAAGGALLLDTLQSLQTGTLEPEKQEDALSCYAPMLSKENTQMHFDRPAQELCLLVRAMNPAPLAHTLYGGKKCKIAWAEPEQDTSDAACGEILRTDAHGILVKCADGAVRIVRLQMEGKKMMEAADFLRGNSMPVGSKFGS